MAQLYLLGYVRGKDNLLAIGRERAVTGWGVRTRVVLEAVHHATLQQSTQSLL
jgi:hypothetical protein